MNGSKKLTISYSKYKMIPLPFWDDGSDEDDEDEFAADERNRDLDSYETADKEMGVIPRYKNTIRTNLRTSIEYKRNDTYHYYSEFQGFKS